jgi:hypothetical protein
VVVNGSLGGTPTFTQIGPVCETDPPINLPTVSLEGIPGTWDVGPTFNPSGLGGTTATITFTPNAGACGALTTMDIVVNAEIEPTPTPIGPFCETDPPVPLPTNIGGITGNWSGTGVTNNSFDPGASTGTISITFTPNAGQCAGPVSTDIEVNAETEPTPSPIGPFCETDPPVPLPTNIGGITGNWSGGGVMNNTFDPGLNTGTIFITFTPDPGQCATTTTTSIVVNAAATPTLGTVTLCESDPPFNLTAIQDPGFPAGTWSGPGVAGTNFNPNGQNGPVSLTFTPSAPCSQPATTTITVNPVSTPTLIPGSTCQNSGPFDLTTLQDPTFPTGTWSGPGVSGTTFNPSGQNGPVTITFTPAGTCVQAATTTVTVEVPGTPALSTTNICQNQGPFDLTVLQDPAFPSGTWSGTGVTTSPIFDPAGLVGSITLTFTPTGCAFAATTTVTVDLPGTPNLGTATICETSGPFDLTTIQDPSFPGGAWSGPGVAGTTFIPAGQSGPSI